ncbi:MAG: hypothetical protein V1750_00700 [Acidobacteriota bacterium]
MNRRVYLQSFGGDRLAFRFILLAALGAVAALLYLPLLPTWFFADDPHWIGAVASRSLTEILLVPETYRAVAPNFTPWLALTFKVDVALFGLAPLGYHIHDLLALALATWSFCLLMRRWLSWEAVLLAALLLWLSPITLATATWPSARHYVEGLLFAAVGLRWCLEPRETRWRSIGAGALFFLAAICKEIYVVLPAVTLILVPGRLVERLKATLWMWVSLACYAAWHLWMMGGIGGYVTNSRPGPAAGLELLRAIPRAFSQHWFGGQSWPLIVLGIALAGGLAALGSLRPVAVFAVLAAPLLPIPAKVCEGHYSHARFVFHLSLVLLVVLAALLDRWRRLAGIWRAAVVASLAGLMATFLWQDLALSHHLRRDRDTARQSAAAFLEAGIGYVRAEQPRFFYEGLRRAYEAVTHRSVGARLLPFDHLLRYATPARLAELKGAGAAIPFAEIERFQAGLADEPISARLVLDRYRLTWELGPVEAPAYTVMLGPEAGLYFVSARNLPPRGSVMLGQETASGASSAFLRVSYQPSGGAEVVTPELVLPVPGTATVEYRKPR